MLVMAINSFSTAITTISITSNRTKGVFQQKTQLVLYDSIACNKHAWCGWTEIILTKQARHCILPEYVLGSMLNIPNCNLTTKFRYTAIQQSHAVMNISKLPKYNLSVVNTISVT